MHNPEIGPPKPSIFAPESINISMPKMPYYLAGAMMWCGFGFLIAVALFNLLRAGLHSLKWMRYSQFLRKRFVKIILVAFALKCGIMLINLWSFEVSSADFLLMLTFLIVTSLCCRYALCEKAHWPLVYSPGLGLTGWFLYCVEKGYNDSVFMWVLVWKTVSFLG